MKRKILIAVILITLVPSLLISAIMHYHTRSSIIEARQDSLKSIVHILDLYFDRQLNTAFLQIENKADMDILKNMLQTPESDMIETNDSETAESIKQLIIEDLNLPIIEGSVINSEGKVVVSSEPVEVGIMLDKTELFQRIAKGSKAYLGLSIEDSDTEKLILAAPIQDNEKNVIGVLRQITKLDYLKEYFGNIEIGDTGYAFLINKNGYMIFLEDERSSIVFYPGYQRGTDLANLIFDFETDQLEEEEGIIEYNKGNEFIGAYKLNDSKSFITVVVMEKKEILSGMNLTTAIVFGLLSFIAILAVVIGSLLENSIQQQIQRIISNTRKINNGDLTARCPSVKINMMNELGSDINNLADRLQKNEKELRLSARIDSLTNLPNRYAIYEVLDTLLYKHPNQALLFLELEGLKVVNANMGHDFGDGVVMEIGDILRSLPDNVCYPSRLGGETFLIFVTNWTAPKYPEMIAEKIIREIEKIRFINGTHVDIGVNIGIQYTEEEKVDKKRLIKQSEIAMSKAKMEGNNLYFVSYSSKQKEV